VRADQLARALQPDLCLQELALPDLPIVEPVQREQLQPEFLLAGTFVAGSFVAGISAAGTGASGTIVCRTFVAGSGSTLGTGAGASVGFKTLGRQRYAGAILAAGVTDVVGVTGTLA